MSSSRFTLTQSSGVRIPLLPLLIAFFLVSVSSVAQEQNKTTFKNEILNGRVDSLDQRIYKINKETGDTTLNYNLKYLFNAIGQLIERSGLGQKTLYSYNSFDKISQVKVCNVLADNCTINDYLYDVNGNLIVHKQTLPKSTSNPTVYFEWFLSEYSYDQNNYLIKEKKYSKRVDDKNETLVEHIVYEYDSLGNKKTETELNQSGIPLKKTEYKYNESGLTETSTWENFEGEDLYSSTFYSYNSTGTISSKTTLIFDYGSKEKVASESFTSFTYEYDVKGNLIKKTEASLNDTVIVFEEYDTFGNWQKMIKQNQKEIEIEIRKLKY